MAVYGIELFSSVILEIVILMCGIAVSSSPAVCGFLSFWLTVFVKEDPLSYGISVPFICVLLSNAGQYLENFTLDLTVNDYPICDR